MGSARAPGLTARGAHSTILVDRKYDAATLSDLSTALHTAGTWLREEQRTPPSAVGHRVVHGGPQYNSPVR